MSFNEKMVTRAVKNYLLLQELYNNTDVSKNREFQTKFNGAYKVSRRSQDFYTTYYNLMESSKHEEITLADILLKIYNITGKLEFSFATKLLATSNPDNPIWDSNVRKTIGIRNVISKGTINERIEDALNLYNELKQYYIKHQNDDKTIEDIKHFDELFPEAANLPFVRKFDFILWASDNN